MLLTISGALREASTNRKLLAEAARLYGGPVTEADLRFPLYDGDLETNDGIPDAVHTLAQQIDDAEAVVISGPEYNGSISGILKNALDWISRVDGNPWADKPVALMAAAAGRSGGARGAYATRLAMVPFRPRISGGPEVLLAASRQAFDDHGTLKDDATRALLGKAMDALRREAHAG
ncbi:NAD(P)H-dependent oxidoreductase [Maribius pontilimi]|uniref:NAD(P)H-dependent oxidoreductase n=1 Tax=Palleronia pontilimi TaxID=1964209 RepID=A0A934MF79_9RHOB|nr:NAD(P)H-dependent oxidoreductase [Palleronia pontilimi]MBJ3764221.1 NAD(P)H-dependent oxidoreductase [Palleronia pontilimi]